MLETWKLAPALASGCTVVLKPAEFTPLSACLWAEIFEEAGLPDGVFNLVNGLGEEAGDALVEHPDVPLISFTGETTHRPDSSSATPPAHLKGLSMELGGKSPVRRLRRRRPRRRDRLDRLFGVFSLNGERCTAGSRILVRARRLRRVRRPATPRGRAAIVVGDPHDPDDRGRRARPPEHYAKVLATSRSARPRAGCSPAADAPTHLPTGNYIAADRVRRRRAGRRASSRRRSSAPSSRSPRSTPTTRRSPWRTTPRTGSPPTSGRTT